MVVGPLLSCADFERGERLDTSADTRPDAPAGSATFSAVHAALTDLCGACHVSGGAAGSSGLVLAGDPETDHAAVLAFVDPEDPAASPLLLKATNQTPHAGGHTLEESSEAWSLMIEWIAAGAAQQPEEELP